MLYLIGGVPRCGKTLLAQRVASALGAGWCSTDTGGAAFYARFGLSGSPTNPLDLMITAADIEASM